MKARYLLHFLAVLHGASDEQRAKDINQRLIKVAASKRSKKAEIFPVSPLARC